MSYYLIGEASKITGLSRDTLRFYEKKGLIHSERRDNGYRMYSEEELCSLVSILYKRRMNYSLKGIGSESEGSDRLEELKETERGVEHMCKELRELYDEGIAEGRAEGIAQGKVEGIALGKAEGELTKARETAIYLAQKGMSIAEIAEAVKFSTQKVQEWLPGSMSMAK